jgi:hypothetical protein
MLLLKTENNNHKIKVSSLFFTKVLDFFHNKICVPFEQNKRTLSFM